MSVAISVWKVFGEITSAHWIALPYKINTFVTSVFGMILFVLVVKGGYLDFSLLTESKNICITEKYVKKQYKLSITKNHRIRKKNIFDGFPLKGYVASSDIFRFRARNKKKKQTKKKKKNIVGESVD